MELLKIYKPIAGLFVVALLASCSVTHNVSYYDSVYSTSEDRAVIPPTTDNNYAPSENDAYQDGYSDGYSTAS